LDNDKNETVITSCFVGGVCVIYLARIEPVGTRFVNEIIIGAQNGTIFDYFSG
jgi:hypothetical protein